MSEEILSSLQAELSRRNQLVDDRRAALEAAVSERDAFVDQIATTLSLGKRAQDQTRESPGPAQRGQRAGRNSEDPEDQGHDRGLRPPETARARRDTPRQPE